MVGLRSVRVQRVEVVALVGRGVQLGVQETRRQDGIDRVVAVAGGVRRRRHVLVKGEVRVVDVVDAEARLGGEDVFLDGTLGGARVIGQRSGAREGEVRVVRRVSRYQQRGGVGGALRMVRVVLRGDEAEVLVQVRRRAVRKHCKRARSELRGWKLLRWSRWTRGLA